MPEGYEGAWRKASASHANSQCVELRGSGRTVLVRDSKAPGGGFLRFDGPAWARFVTAVKTR